MKPPRSHYQSYVLRLWRSNEGEPWRVMLERIDSHERLGFADLEGLFAFLKRQTDHTGQPPETLVRGKE
jgi:hypothetical protein